MFDLVHPHIYHIGHRSDRAMRFAKSSPHPFDAAALIFSFDTHGALSTLCSVAQNASFAQADLEQIALPLRKLPAPALLRTLFLPEIRVSNEAKKVLRQLIAIASFQNTPWISTICSALSLPTAC